MPATSEKQRRFFGAVMAAKKGKKGVGGKARDAAKGMSKDTIKDFLKKKGEVERAYLQGFMAKCAECGVDPQVLVKRSARGEQLMRLLTQASPEVATPARMLLRNVEQTAPATLGSAASRLDRANRIASMTASNVRGGAAGRFASHLGVHRANPVLATGHPYSEANLVELLRKLVSSSGRRAISG